MLQWIDKAQGGGMGGFTFHSDPGPDVSPVVFLNLVSADLGSFVRHELISPNPRVWQIKSAVNSLRLV